MGVKQKLLEKLYEPYLINIKDSDIYIDGASCFVPGEGNSESKIVFVGEAPGASEDKFQRPFVGRAGKLLRKTLIELECLPEKIYITNIVKCRPPKNRKPTEKEIELGNKILEKELEIINPKWIVTLGLSSLKGLLNNKTITMSKSRGNFISYKDKFIYSLYHPAFILRKQSELPTFVKDLKYIIDKMDEI
jgi:uracil-DNA glycosylase family 4